MSPDFNFLDFAAQELGITALINIFSKFVSTPPAIVNPKYSLESLKIFTLLATWYDLNLIKNLFFQINK